MQIRIIDEIRTLCIWLTHSEAKSSSHLTLLEPFYKAAKQKKYIVTVFESGNEDLKESIIGLLINQKNKNDALGTNLENRGT